MNRLLIATDGSPAADAAVQAGVQLAAEQLAGVVFLHVVEEVDAVAPSFGPIIVNPVEQGNPEDDEILSAAAEIARTQGVPFDLRLVAGIRLRDDPGHGGRDRRRADRDRLEPSRRARDDVPRQRLQGGAQAGTSPSPRRPSHSRPCRGNRVKRNRKEHIR